MRSFIALLFAFFALAAGSSSARTWYVMPDGAGDALTIKAGIDSARFADTVMVACGTYYEYDIAIKSGVYLTSETGFSDCVTIDAGSQGKVFYAGGDSSASIVGFTAINARCEGFHYWEGSGGGLYESESEIEVSNCVFRDNWAQCCGAGAYVAFSSSIYTNCVFSNNLSVGEDMEYPYYENGGGVQISGEGSPTFVNCVFSKNTNWFKFGGGVALWWHAHATFENCVFSDNVAGSAQYTGGGLAVLDNSFAELSNCTFFRNLSRNPTGGGGVFCLVGSSVSLENCIIAFSMGGRALWWDGCEPEPSISCCDFYGNWDGDWIGMIAHHLGRNGNISEDPLFCDRLADDLYLCATSPCLGTGPCGTMGAYGQGCIPDAGAVVWTDVTTSTLGHGGPGSGLAWVDYDADGDLDIFFTNRATAKNILLRNDSLSSEGFVDVTPPVLAGVGNSRGCPWGDYDNDGDPDLYVSNRGANRLLRNDGDSGFVDVTLSPLDDAGTGQSAAWFDYDNDGDLDLYVVNNGTNKLFRNDSAGVFTDVTSGALGDSSWGMGLGLADYDSDGDMDVYVANYDGPNLFLENQGGDVFADVTTPVLECALASYGAVWGDYDNDGDLDLYVTNEGSNNLLRNDGGAFTDVSASPVDDAGAGRSAAWGDCDNDGDLDLYLVNYESANRIFRNEGSDVFTEYHGCGSAAPFDTLGGFGTGWADYDKDGDLDIYLVNDGANKLFRNESEPGNHWLEVDPVGTVSNTSGIGVRVRIVAGGATQMREIGGASGFASQGPLTAWFGLGAECAVDTVEVTWPASGTIQTITGIACDQTLEVIEDPLSGVPDREKTPPAFQLYANRPNPFTAETVIRYDLPERSHVGLAIYDVSGRSVCTLLDGEYRDPGQHVAHWDGRNSDGQPAAPGIYFCRFTAGPCTQIQRLVLLK